MNAGASIRSSSMPRRAHRHSRRQSVWAARIGLVTHRHVRGRLIAAFALALVLVGTLVLLFASRRSEQSQADPNLSVLLGISKLPAAPEADMAAPDMAPAPLAGPEATVLNGRAPFTTLGPAARPFHFAGAFPDRLRARACLAAAMLYEAGDDAVGQLAVGQVILNRARHPAFPASVCGVVTQGSERATGCQFTFTCDGTLVRPVSAAARARALVHADLMLDGLVFPGVGLATHYHTVDVYPWWSPQLEKIARVGPHLFFRWPGYWGSAHVAHINRRGPEPSAALFAQFGVSSNPDVNKSDTVEAQLAWQTGNPTSSAMPVGGGGSPSRLSGMDAVAAIPPARRLLPQQRADDGAEASVVSVPTLEGPTLEGHRLLRAFQQEGVFFLQVVPGSSEASRRRVATLLCGGREECRVYGWRDAGMAPATSRLDPASQALAVFAFIKNADDRTRSASPAATGLPSLL